MSTLGHDIRSKQPHRDALDRDVQEYLRKGGTVEVLETVAVSSTAATEDDEEDGP